MSSTIFSLNMNSHVFDAEDVGLFSELDDFEYETGLLLTSSSSKINVKEIRYKKSYAEIISEIGGHMGLFIGASLITILEFIELIFLVVSKGLSGRTRPVDIA